MVDVRGIGEVRGLVGNVSRHWMGLMPASKALVKGCGLYDSLVGELLVRRRYDGEARWWSLLRHRRGLQASTEGVELTR